MIDSNSPWMNGTEANAQAAATNGLIQVGTAIFGAIGANKYSTDYRFKHEDVVIEETARDNHALIVTGGSFLLLIVLIVILLR